jgi:hypothetical protein
VTDLPFLEARYLFFYKRTLPLEEEWAEKWDIFVSAYNSSDRVKSVFKRASAAKKYWLIQPDYEYTEEEYPTGEVFAHDVRNEAAFIEQFFNPMAAKLKGKSLCIDITGFIKPYMMMAMRWLRDAGLDKVDVLYSEPQFYAKKEKTVFSDEVVSEVRQVSGFAGVHIPDTSNDLLIINSGYDHELIAQVAENKNNSRKLQMFGLPSLRPDMYQENILRANLAAESVGGSIKDTTTAFFAPANDPFVTANVLNQIVERERQRNSVTNIYLSPLATKPQALGFVLYYLTECINQPISMIYPFCKTHSQETAKGLSRVWLYEVPFVSI